MEPKEVLDFWLDKVGPDQWYDDDPDLDEMMRDRFEAAWESARDGGFEHWMVTPEGALALLILARAMQGVAAGLIQPMSMFLIFQTFPDHQRGTAIGIFSIGVVLAPAFGPALGGVAVDLASWRLVFVATVPLAIAALGAASFLMPDADPENRSRRQPLDWLGLGLLSVGIVLLLSAFAGGNRDGWDSDITLTKLSVSIVSLIAFYFWERRHPHPALNPAIFAYRQFWSAGLIIAATGIAIYGSTYLIPLFVQLVQHYSPTAAGIMMIPAGLAMVIGFPIAGRLTDKVDARLLLAFGIVSFAISAYLLSHVSMLTPYMSLVWWIVRRIRPEGCIAELALNLNIVDEDLFA